MINKAKTEVIDAIDMAVSKLSKVDYLEVLELLSEEIDVRIDVVEGELKKDEEGAQNTNQETAVEQAAKKALSF